MSTSNGNQFKSKLGLIAATVGSAVGLGNVWRFPAEAQAGGGAAFLLIYILCVLVLGIPVMVAEFSLGRAGATDVIGVFPAVMPQKRGWSAVGVLSVITPTLISLFYMVVTGWTLEYLWGSLSGDLYSSSADVSYFTEKMHEYVQTPVLPAIFTAIAVILNLGVLLSGVSKGIERLSNILMPLLFILLLIFCGVSMTLPNAADGLSFFLKPDFSKITPATWLSALGQAFFSLSLGMGILVTYAAYYPARTRLVRTAITVSLLDMLVAVMMGIIIFPAVMTFGLQDHGLTGTTLIFVTLPEVFTHIPGSAIWSALFFLLLFIAALTSTVSITEVTVRCLQDRLGFSRRKAVFWLMVPVLLLSVVCSQSFSSISGFTILGRNMFDFLDFLTAELLLPVASIGLCLYMGWVAPKKLLENQMTNFGRFKSRLFIPVLLIVRYVAPLLILLVLISPLL